MMSTGNDTQTLETNQAQIIENKEPADTGESEWLKHLISLATTVLVVLVAIVSYHFLVVEKTKQKYAFVDIAEVLSIKELQVTIATMKPDATDATRGEAFEAVATFGKEMEGVISDLQRECGCSIFVRAAVVKPLDAEDLTGELKRRLGMHNLNQSDLAKQLRMLGGRGSAPMLEEQRK